MQIKSNNGKEVGTLRAKDKKEINILVGENIRFYREQANLSREKLAELFEVSPRFLADLELGFVGASLTTIKKLCEVLGISADRLLWDRQAEPVDLTERFCHVPPAYQEVLIQLLLKQLELIALAGKEGERRKLRN